MYSEDGDVVAAFYKVKRKQDKLVIDGKALDAIQMDMVLTPEETLKGLRMVFSPDVVSFLFLLPYFYLRRLLQRTGSQNYAEANDESKR